MASNQQDQHSNKQNDKLSRPDPETLHTTDPQENMKGPVSSIMQDIKKEAEEENSKSKEQADEERERNM